MHNGMRHFFVIRLLTVNSLALATGVQFVVAVIEYVRQIDPKLSYTSQLTVYKHDGAGLSTPATVLESYGQWTSAGCYVYVLSYI